MNCCSVTELKAKEVISTKSGCRIGYVGDVEINLKEGRLVAIIIFGKSRFGLFSRENDFRICWEDIEVIGEDTILVHTAPPPRPPKPPRKNAFDSVFKY